MPYLLNILYLLLLVVCSPWLLYAAIRKGKYREGFAAKFLGRVPLRQGDARCVWLHAVSVGEVNLLAPLLMRLEREHPDWVCVISTTTKTGYSAGPQEVRAADRVLLPTGFQLGGPRARCAGSGRTCSMLAELELWPNLIRAAKSTGVPVAIVNGRLSDHSLGAIAGSGRCVAPHAAGLDLIAVQNGGVRRAVPAAGCPAETVLVTGSVKYDGAQTDRGNARHAAAGRTGGASTRRTSCSWPAARSIPRKRWPWRSSASCGPRFPPLRLIIVPRHPERFDDVANCSTRPGCPGSGAADWRTAVPPASPHPAGRRRRRTGRLVGHGPDRLRGRQPGQTRRAEHDRTGRLRRRRVLRPQHREFPRRGHADAGSPGRRRGAGRRRADGLRRPLPAGAGATPGSWASVPASWSASNWRRRQDDPPPLGPVGASGHPARTPRPAAVIAMRSAERLGTIIIQTFFVLPRTLAKKSGAKKCACGPLVGPVFFAIHFSRLSLPAEVEFLLVRVPHLPRLCHLCYSTPGKIISRALALVRRPFVPTSSS